MDSENDKKYIQECLSVIEVTDERVAALMRMISKRFSKPKNYKNRTETFLYIMLILHLSKALDVANFKEAAKKERQKAQDLANKKGLEDSVKYCGSKCPQWKTINQEILEKFDKGFEEKDPERVFIDMFNEKIAEAEKFPCWC